MTQLFELSRYSFYWWKSTTFHEHFSVTQQLCCNRYIKHIQLGIFNHRLYLLLHISMY